MTTEERIQKEEAGRTSAIIASLRKEIEFLNQNTHEIMNEFHQLKERNKENAVALLNWMAINNYREVGVDSETGAYFAKFQGNVCCSDYYKPEQLYDLFINEQNKKV